MVDAFVLLDAAPGLGDEVYASLDKLKGAGLAGKERCRSDSFDILVKVHGRDDDAVEDFIATHLRFISGVVNLRRIRAADEEPPAVRAAMQKLR